MPWLVTLVLSLADCRSTSLSFLFRLSSSLTTARRLRPSSVSTSCTGAFVCAIKLILIGWAQNVKDLTSSSCFLRVSLRSNDARRCESSSMILFCCRTFVSRSRSNSVSISFCKMIMSWVLATHGGGHKPRGSTNSSPERKVSQGPELASPCYDGASSSPARGLLCYA